MDIDHLIEKINEDRRNDLRIVYNSGKEVDVPPGAIALVDATDTIHIHWPPLDPVNPFRVSRSITLGAVYVASIKFVT